MIRSRYGSHQPAVAEPQARLSLTGDDVVIGSDMPAIVVF
jgi:hypothetical protein